jgi:digeranylgeranylglycerophospholipid reductase
MKRSVMTSPARSDVLVVGAGPSGLRVAARLAAAGLSVRVFEKKPAVGENIVCTGIVGREVFERFGLDSGSVLREIRDVRLVSPFGTRLEYAHPRPFACVVDRERFDTSLAAAAEFAGAVLSTGCRVDDISVGAGDVRASVRADGRRTVHHSAAVAVIASGVDAVLQKKAGLSSPRDFLMGAQAEVPAFGADVTTVFFGRNVAPGAFAWSVPTGRTSRVGLLTRKDPRVYLRKLLEGVLGPQSPPAGELTLWTKPVAQGLLARTAGERVLSVGEAAGQMKTTTGGGISFGLLCADIAADEILECFRRSAFGAGSLARYETRWREAIRKEIVVGAQARRFCARLSDRQVEGLFHLARTDGIMPIIRETADFDWHSGLLLALLRRLSFMTTFRREIDTLGRGSFS